jgi:predicted RNA-binding protein
MKASPYQKFVALCECVDDEYEELEKAKDDHSCKPSTPVSKGEKDLYFYRKKVHYLKFNEVEVRPLINDLSFIKNKSKWGFPFMSGFMEINQNDFDIICGNKKVKSLS